jgi:hypothetical protein
MFFFLSSINLDIRVWEGSSIRNAAVTPVREMIKMNFENKRDAVKRLS